MSFRYAPLTALSSRSRTRKRFLAWWVPPSPRYLAAAALTPAAPASAAPAFELMMFRRDLNQDHPRSGKDLGVEISFGE
jgi:hypothetical protein